MVIWFTRTQLNDSDSKEKVNLLVYIKMYVFIDSKDHEVKRKQWGKMFAKSLTES